MTISQLLESNVVQKIGRKPVVVLPLEVWREIESQLEDLAIAESKQLKKKIAKARSEKRLYSSSAVKDLLGI